MKKSSAWKGLGEFVMGKGFYIALFLCVATIGISGYYLVSQFNSVDLPDQSVTGPAKVTVPVLPEEPTVPSQDEPAAPKRQDPDPSAERSEQPEAAISSGTQEPVTAQVSAPPVYTWPVKGEIFSDFSLEVLAYDETMGDWRTHSGVDIAAAEGTRVLAMSSGTVSGVYEDDLMGMTVVIDHGDGLVSSYHNLTQSPAVTVGDTVVTGTVIGAVGNTALAEVGRPSHLHLEVTLNARQVDPVDYLPKY